MCGVVFIGEGIGVKVEYLCMLVVVYREEG